MMQTFDLLSPGKRAKNSLKMCLFANDNHANEVVGGKLVSPCPSAGL